MRGVVDTLVEVVARKFPEGLKASNLMGALWAAMVAFMLVLMRSYTATVPLSWLGAWAKKEVGKGLRAKTWGEEAIPSENSLCMFWKLYTSSLSLAATTNLRMCVCWQGRTSSC